MINIRSILKLRNNDGLTLKAGKPITYKTGWQVATEGVETRSAREAINAVKAYGGNCVITNYAESSNSSDDATYTIDFRVTGNMTATT